MIFLPLRNIHTENFKGYIYSVIIVNKIIIMIKISDKLNVKSFKSVSCIYFLFTYIYIPDLIELLFDNVQLWQYHCLFIIHQTRMCSKYAPDKNGHPGKCTHCNILSWKTRHRYPVFGFQFHQQPTICSRSILSFRCNVCSKLLTWIKEIELSSFVLFN